ncbi:hypothetical protein SNE40_019453 [Patella caerulea]|uniref:LRAT domain-containing protein n=1 Tax=Patella caerulea TaxID=87958 RepID=A0AAN8J9H0_PATCE
MSRELGLHNLQVLDQLEEGDIVKFERGWFSHYGVYVGNTDIVHLMGDSPNELLGTSQGISVVKKENFWDVANKSKAFKHNRDGVNFRPSDKKTIVNRAMSRVGDNSDYHVIYKNCEHFANWCRYDAEDSSQVNVVLTTLAAVGFFIGAKFLGLR